MFKARGLNSSASRLRFLQREALCAPRASRSITTTLAVSRRRHDKHQSPDKPGHLAKFHDHDSPAVETDMWQHEVLQGQTLPSAQVFERPLHLWREAWPEDEIADQDGFNETNECTVRRTRRYSDIQMKILAAQAFHARIHPTLLKNITQIRPLLAGMPVYDTTFDAVRSGRNLFIEAPGSVRSLQYLLPLVHGILKGGARRQDRGPEVLVICPSVDDAGEIDHAATRLLKRHGPGLRIAVMGTPAKWNLLGPKSRGYNMILSTPELLLQWLALGHKKALLLEQLQNLKTLVFDGGAGHLLRHDFLETLGGVMEDLSLSPGTQRVVITDKLGPELQGHFENMDPSAVYEVHHEPRLGEIHALREESRLDEKEEKQERRQERRRLRQQSGNLRLRRGPFERYGNFEEY